MFIPSAAVRVGSNKPSTTMPSLSPDIWQESALSVLVRPRLAEYTTLRLGGVAPVMVLCRTPHELIRAVMVCRGRGQPFIVMGGGTNVLCSDEGINAVVLRYCSETLDVVRAGDRLFRVSGASRLDDLVSWTVREGWEGLQEMSGIPGTVGGGVAGNAGAFGRAIGDVVVEATVLDENGQPRVRSREQLGFSYRHSRLKETGEILVDVTVRLRRADAGSLQQRRRDILALRRDKHPDPSVWPTAGSFFRNLAPTSAARSRQAAGYFLEQAGAKFLRVGKARVFEKHANIIVTEPGASAHDVYRLAQKMHELCLKRFGIDLVREVRLLGRFDGKGETTGWW